MAKLPVLSGREVIKILGKAGFKPVRQKGSHIVVCTLLEIIRQAGLKREAFEKLL